MREQKQPGVVPSGKPGKPKEIRGWGLLVIHQSHTTALNSFKVLVPSDSSARTTHACHTSKRQPRSCLSRRLGMRGGAASQDPGPWGQRSPEGMLRESGHTEFSSADIRSTPPAARPCRLWAPAEQPRQ